MDYMRWFLGTLVFLFLFFMVMGALFVASHTCKGGESAMYTLFTAVISGAKAPGPWVTYLVQNPVVDKPR